jgi:hypothetical protein
MNSELHHRTVDVLTKLVDVLDCDDLSLLCWHAGVSVTELMPVEPAAPTGELFAAYIEQERHHEIHC